MKIYEVWGDHDHYTYCNMDVLASIVVAAQVNPGTDLDITLDGTKQSETWWPRVMLRANKKIG